MWIELKIIFCPPFFSFEMAGTTGDMNHVEVISIKITKSAGT